MKKKPSNSEQRNKYKLLRHEFENGDENGEYNTIAVLAKKYKVPSSQIYKKIKKESWDITKNVHYSPNPKLSVNQTKLNNAMIKKVEKYGGKVTGKSLAILLGITEITLSSYRKSGQAAYEKFCNYVQCNYPQYANVHPLELIEIIDFLSSAEKLCVKFILAWEKAIADKELFLNEIIEKGAKGYEIPNERYEVTVDANGKVHKRKITETIHVKSNPSDAKWLLQHRTYFKDKYIRPDHKQITLEGGQNPIHLQIEEKNRMVDAVMERLEKAFPVEPVEPDLIEMDKDE
jgi:hypothetical protein